MRPLLLLLGWLAATLASVAQEKIVQDFSGSSAITTATFQVGDRWEIRWDAPVSISLLGADGQVVAGMAGAGQGSIYQPKGGTFSLKIDGTGPWHVKVIELGATPAPTASVAIYVPPAPPSTNAPAPTPTPPATNTAASTPPATNAPPSNPKNLTEEQAQAVVVIKGDRGEGSGFLVHTKDGPAVVTNQHVLSANPNIHILTTTGAEIKMVSLKGASDRDLALIGIQDNHYSYLEQAQDVAAIAQPGDAVITPGNSEGGGVVLDTRGELRGIGPDAIEVSNPIYHGNSGGPVVHLASGKVLGVVSFGAANANSAITGKMRYFAYRLDTVPSWETYDLDRFMAQTTFLKNFEEINRCLDSLLNGKRYEKAHLTSMNPEEGAPSSLYYTKNEKIRAFAESYQQHAANAGGSERLDAQRELVMDLDGLIDKDVPAIQNANNFYSFAQKQAKHDYQYRQALKKEIDGLGDKISDLGH